MRPRLQLPVAGGRQPGRAPGLPRAAGGRVVRLNFDMLKYMYMDICVFVYFCRRGHAKKDAQRFLLRLSLSGHRKLHPTCEAQGGLRRGF